MRFPKRASLLIFSIHAAAFAALTWWSWRKWPDPLIDFGRELYVPWQITQGRVLYRDIASLFGPLSPYINALWFRLLGVSLTTLVLCNLAVLAAMLAGIYRLLRTSSDRTSAAAATLSAMVLFGFSQYVIVGNYNFVTPYSHEAAHGLALSVMMLLALCGAIASGRLALFATAGLSFGAVLLTKPETSVAAAVAVITGFAAMQAFRREERAPVASTIAVFFVGALLPALAFFAYFRMHMPAIDAARAVAGAWMPVLSSGVAANDFYRVVTGFDAPIANVLRMAWMFVAFAAFVGVGIAAAVSRWRPGRLLFLAGVVLLVPLSGFARALPLTTLSAFIASALLFVRRRADRASAVRILPMLTWSAFAFVLLAKIALNARVFHYGFYLALPAATVTIVFLVGLVPQWLDDVRSGGAGGRFRTLAICMVVAAVAPYLAMSAGLYRTKTIPIGSGGDRFYASSLPSLWQGAAVRDALEQIESLNPPGSMMAVLPEGVMLNYLSRRPTPLRVINLMPPELIAFGESDVLESLRRSPPDLVLLIDREVSEYGYPPFGVEQRYGKATVTWVKAHYDLERAIANHIEIFKRKRM